MTKPNYSFRAASAAVSLSAIAVVMTACAGFLNPDERVSPAVIQESTELAQITYPDTVQRGVPFEVRIRTFGEGCDLGVDHSKVTTVDGMAEIRPFNRQAVGGDCDAIKTYPLHRVQVQIDRAGPATIRVIGKGVGLASGGAEVRIERAVWVR